MHTRLLKVLITAMALGSASQGCVSSREVNEPIHMNVFCLSAAGKQACDISERLSLFNEWIGEAVSRPHSTFTIWQVGENRKDSHLYFRACVPETWGPGVMEAKAAFVKAVREKVSARHAGSLVGERCSASGSPTTGIQRIRVLGIGSNMPDNWKRLSSQPEATKPLHTAIVCDRSSSTLGIACNPDGLIGAFDQWLAESGVAKGASISLYIVGSSRDTTKRAFTLRVPDTELGERFSFILGARAELNPALATDAGPNASALAEAISVAVNELRERKGRYRMIVLSDSRQFTPGVWNFERSIPTPEGFIKWLKETNLSVNLNNVAVIACGLHNQRGPGARAFDGTHSKLVRDTWEHSFRAMGATDVTMLATCENALSLETRQ